MHIASKRYSKETKNKYSEYVFFFYNSEKAVTSKEGLCFEGWAKICLLLGVFSCHWWIIKQFSVCVWAWGTLKRTSDWCILSWTVLGMMLHQRCLPLFFSLLHSIWNPIHSPTLWSSLRGLNIDVCVYEGITYTLPAVQFVTCDCHAVRNCNFAIYVYHGALCFISNSIFFTMSPVLYTFFALFLAHIQE